MAQQDLIRIHNVKNYNQQIAPHEDLVGMLQLIRDEGIITIINKQTGGNAELITLLSIPLEEVNGDGIYALHKNGSTNRIEHYKIIAPTVDAEPENPIEQIRNSGVGLIITETELPPDIDPKLWSRIYHIELDRTVVRQTANAVIIEHNLEGTTSTTPINFALEPTIRNNDIGYMRIGSGNFVVTFYPQEGRYAIRQENTRSDGSQDNHEFHIPAFVAIKDIPNSGTDEPSIELVYDPQAQTPTGIKLTEQIKDAINKALIDITPELSFDLTDTKIEKLKLRLTLNKFDAVDSVTESTIDIPQTITDWGEIDGDITEQADLNAEFLKKADKIITDSGEINLPDIPPMIDDKITVHNSDTTAHNDIRQGAYNDLLAHNTSATAHEYIRQKIETDITTHDTATAAHTDIREKIGADITTHDTSETAHEYIRQKIETDITTHNNNIAAHPDIKAYFNTYIDQEISEGIDVHNSNAQAHTVIQQALSQNLETHNNDPQEDQHPLLRSLIASIEQAIEPFPLNVTGLADGEYKLAVINGVAGWVTL